MENENRKFTIVSFFAFSSIVGLVLDLLIGQIMFAFKWGGQNVLFGLSARQTSLALSVLGGLTIFFVLALSAKATGFIDEVFSELKKTTWPKLQETGISTAVVSIMIGVAALILFFMDTVWGLFFKTLL